jgi:hypothetical protein
LTTHDVGYTWSGYGKRKRLVYYNTDSFMKLSKFFIDRPSDQGFRKGLGVNLVKPKFNNVTGMNMNTAFELPDFNNTAEEFVMGLNGRPFYLHPALHIALMCCGLFYISFLIILWGMPGKSTFGSKGKKIQIRL